MTVQCRAVQCSQQDDSAVQYFSYSIVYVSKSIAVNRMTLQCSHQLYQLKKIGRGEAFANLNEIAKEDVIC
jgi:hypothetical protein